MGLFGDRALESVQVRMRSLCGPAPVDEKRTQTHPGGRARGHRENTATCEPVERPQKATALPTPDLGLLTGLRENKFPLLKPPNLWHFVVAPPGNEHNFLETPVNF